MKNTKLIKLLQTFSPAEIKKFRDFVNSPYFNKNKNILKLNNELEKHYPDFDQEKMNEELIYRKVFRTGKYDYFKIKNIISDLYNLGLEFLKQQSNIFTSFSGDYNMIAQLRDRKLWNYHTKFVENYLEKFCKTQIKDRFYLYNEYLLLTEKQISNILKKPNSTETIQESFNSFHDFTLLSLLRFYALMLHVNKENRSAFEMKMFDDVYNYIIKEDNFTNPTIIIYKYIILLTVTRSNRYYTTLKQQYFRKFSSLSYEDAYYAHMYIFGYCMDKFNIDADRDFISECYDLFKLAFEYNMVSLGILLYPDYVNYVKVFMRYGDKKLTMEFINKYKHHLPEEQSENCINFCNAYIAHREGNLKPALALISKVNFPLQILKVQVKILQIQLNFELEYYEETRVQAEYFRKSMLKEEQISPDIKQSIFGFLKLMIMLIDLKLSNEKAARESKVKKFKEKLDINQKNHFGIKFWLEDRFAEIIQK